MKQLLVKALIGVLFSTAGMFCTYLFLRSMAAQINYFFLFFVVLFLGVGIYFLNKASKSYQWVSTVETDTTVTGPVEKHKSIIEQNRELSEQWSNTNAIKDRLKMLKAEAAAEEE